MYVKKLGITIAVCLSALLVMPFSFIYADDDIEVTDLPAVTTTELVTDEAVPLPLQDDVITTTDVFEEVIDSVVYHAADDIISVLDDNLVVYDPELPDQIYDLIYPYVHDDTTEYVVELVRDDLHELILSHVTTDLYNDDVVKSVDKVYDSIFVVSSDQQDLIFYLVVIITLLSVSVTLQVLEYFVR